MKRHLLAGAAVLVTGGFDATDEVKKLADELELADYFNKL